MTHDVCPQCGMGVGPRVVMSVGSSVSVTVTIERAPVVTCPADHVRLELRTGFVDEVVAAVSEAIPSVRHMPLRSDRCGFCRSRLTMPSRRTERPVTVEVIDAPVFTVLADLPMTRCPACGMDQTPASVDRDVEAAVRSALVVPGPIPA